MNIWENAVITNKGVELQAKILAGQKITITSVKTGSGSVPATQINDQLEVANIKQTCTVQPIQMDGNTAIIPVLLTNIGLAESYNLRQVGFYAKDTDGTDILFAIAQNTEPRQIPSETEMAGYSLYWKFHFTMDNNVNLTANIDPAGLISLQTVENHIKQNILKFNSKNIISPGDSEIFTVKVSELIYNKLTGHVLIDYHVVTKRLIETDEILDVGVINAKYAPTRQIPLIISSSTKSSGTLQGAIYPNGQDGSAANGIRCRFLSPIASGFYIFIQASYYIEPGIS